MLMYVLMAMLIEWVKGENNMQFLELEDINPRKIEEFIKIFEQRKELKDFLGGCPPQEYQKQITYSPCHFYCDDCWINALTNVIKDKKKGGVDWL